MTFTKSKYCYILRRGSTYFGIEGVLSNMVDVDCCIFLKGGTMLYELELIGTFRPLAIEIFNSEIASKTKNKKYPVHELRLRTFRDMRLLDILKANSSKVIRRSNKRDLRC